MLNCPLNFGDFAVREGDDILVKCDGKVHYIDESHALPQVKWTMGGNIFGSREDGWDIEKDSPAWIKEEGRHAWKVLDGSENNGQPVRISMKEKEFVEVWCVRADSEMPVCKKTGADSAEAINGEVWGYAPYAECTAPSYWWSLPELKSGKRQLRIFQQIVERQEVHVIMFVCKCVCMCACMCVCVCV